MTDPMSEDAQIQRARKARHILSHAINSVVTRRIARDLTSAFVPADQDPLARTQVPASAVTATESWIEQRLAVLNETGWRHQDSPVEPPVDTYAEPTPGLKTDAIDDMLEMLGSAHARLTALEPRLLHKGDRQHPGPGMDDLSGT